MSTYWVLEDSKRVLRGCLQKTEIIVLCKTLNNNTGGLVQFRDSATSMRFVIFNYVLVIFLLFSQSVQASEGRWILIGTLHNFYQSLGCEPEEDFGDEQQYGLRWNALYDHQDSQASRGLWIGVANFQDPVAETTFDYKIAYCGPRPRPTIEADEFMPQEFSVEGRFPAPEVYINGERRGALDDDDLSNAEIHPGLPADRIIRNRVNTSTGITLTRTISALSQQNYNDFIICEYEFINTGICNSDGSISHLQTLDSVYFSWQYRNAIAGEGTVEGSVVDYHGRRGWGTPQNCRWGINTMNDVIGEDPDNPRTNSLFADEGGRMGVDEYDNNGDIIRAIYSWHGKHSAVVYDNIGSPNYQGYMADGMLGASQFVGAVVLHADTSPQDRTDDIYQPRTTQKIESNNPETTVNDQYNSERMTYGYTHFLSAGHETTSHAEQVKVQGNYADQFAVAGGYSQIWSFGPYSMASGDTVRIVLAEAAAGLSREMNYQVGNTWYRSVALGESPELYLPDGSSTSDPNVYKDTWVYTGRDSLMQTFRHALHAWETGLGNLAQPPQPPAIFEILSAADHLLLDWDASAETNPHFNGYRIYRATNDFNRFYQPVFECGPGTGSPEVVHTWRDFDVTDTLDYYYTIVSVDDGTQNQINPGVPLESGKFWCLSSRPVTVADQPLLDADLYVSPTGNDDNSGLTSAEPMRTIRWAIDRILTSQVRPHTIFLAPGIYSASTNGEDFPIECKTSLHIQGDLNDLPILDAQQSSRVISMENDENVYLENLILTHGGLQCLNANGVLRNVHLVSNSASRGGGILCSDNSNLELIGVNLTANSASQYGGGYYRDATSTIVLSPEVRCNIHSNVAEDYGADIAEDGLDNTFLLLDTFTVASPSDYHAFGRHFELDILHTVLAQIDADLFVSPNGNDANTGQSAEQPLKTIKAALTKIQASQTSPKTIHLAGGIYSTSNSGEAFPLYLRSFVAIRGNQPATTVLDAEMLGRVINLFGDRAVNLEGITLKNGSGGYLQNGGGIHCGPLSELILDDVVIRDNSAHIGGGIYCAPDAELLMSRVSIHDNYAVNQGGGIYFAAGSLQFDNVERSSIYQNFSGYEGLDLFAITNPLSPQIQFVSLDTFTVVYPLERYAAPLELFTFSVLTGIIPQAEADLYVSPLGSDANSGLSPENPLKTIAYARDLIFADAARPHTIHLLPGTYSASSNNEMIPVRMKNHVSLSGDPEGGSILDAENMGQAILFENVISTSLTNLEIMGGFAYDGAGISCLNSSGLLFSNLRLSQNVADNYGGAIYVEGSEIILNDLIFHDNAAKYGAGLALFDSYSEIERCLFYNDSARFGAGLYSRNSTIDLDQLTISDEEAGIRGAAITLWTTSAANLTNSIVWNNGEESFYVRPDNQLTIRYSDIEGGDQAISGSDFVWGEGNIDEFPDFCDAENGDYRIAPESPCIAAGEGGVNLGALALGCAVALAPPTTLPEAFCLLQNFPNPFNPSTNIRYGLVDRTDLNIRIYDILGRVVYELNYKDQAAGWYNLEWSATDATGRGLGAGIYYFQILTANSSAVIKLIYLK